MSDQWFYKPPQSKEPTGPVSLLELRDLERAGALPPATLIREGEGAWHTLRSLIKEWERNGADAHAERGTASETAGDDADDVVAVADEPDVEPFDLDSMDISIVGEREFDTAEGKPATPARSDDDVQPVAEAGEEADLGGLDDLNITLVDESDAPPVRTQRQRSRVLAEEEWSDAEKFDADVVAKAHAGSDADELREELRQLRELAEKAFSAGAAQAHAEAEASQDAGEAEPAAGAEAAGAGDGGGWYLRVEGDVHGPIDFDTLREWAEDGRVLEEDELQLPGADVWIPAGSLPVLFAGIAEGSAPAEPSPPPPTPPKREEPEPPAEPRAPVAESRPPEPERETAASAATGTMGMGGSPSVPASPSTAAMASGGAAAGQARPAGPAAGFAGGNPGFATARSAPKKKSKKGKIGRGPSRTGESIRGLFSSISMPTEVSPVQIGVLVVCALVLAWMFWPAPDYDQAHYDMLMDHYQTYQSLRETGASEQQWEAFRQEANPEVEALAEELKETASSKEPEKQRLLWAARDAWPELVRQPQEGNPKEEEFEKYMAEAKLYLDGNAPVATEGEEVSEPSEDGEAQAPAEDV